jgi:histidinol-phosphate aminotransferase
VLLIDNPNNPLGSYMNRAEVEHLLTSAPPEVIVVMDEAYFEYADADDYPNTLELRHLRDRLVVLRTFSKIYGLAGLRVGYGIGPAGLVSYVNRLRAPFNVSLVSQEAAIVALDDQEHVRASRAHNLVERARLTRRLSELGARVTPSQTNFVLCHFDRPAAALNQALLRQGVIVRPFAQLPEALRITVGTVAENERFLTALAEVLA